MKYTNILKAVAVGVIALCALVLVGFGVNAFGHSQYVVESGSMQPSISTGSIVFDSRSASYKVGDVITFHPIGSKDSVTHRIVKETTDGGETAYIVKGDANNAADPDPVPANTVLGKVNFSIPYIGYGVNAVRSLPGLIILVIIPATIIIYQEFTSISREVMALRGRRKTAATTKDKATARGVPGDTDHVASKPRRSSNVVVVLMIAATGLTYTGATRASFTSDVALTGVTFQAGAYASN